MCKSDVAGCKSNGGTKKHKWLTANIVKSNIQGDHSADNVTFPDGLQHSSAALGVLSVTHITPVLVLLSVVGVGMQQRMIQNHIFNI